MWYIGKLFANQAYSISELNKNVSEPQISSDLWSGNLLISGEMLALTIELPCVLVRTCDITYC